MLVTFLVVIISVFLVICAWSAFEVYLDKRKENTPCLKAISQSTDDQ